MAFPAISTGIYKFPQDEAAAVAVATVASFIERAPDSFEKIGFVCFDSATAAVYEQALKDHLATSGSWPE